MEAEGPNLRGKYWSKFKLSNFHLKDHPVYSVLDGI